MRREAYTGSDGRGAACACRRSAEVAQRAALAHIVAGTAQRRPSLLQVAEALLIGPTVGARLSQQPAGAVHVYAMPMGQSYSRELPTL